MIRPEADTRSDFLLSVRFIAIQAELVPVHFCYYNTCESSISNISKNGPNFWWRKIMLDKQVVWSSFAMTAFYT